MTQIVELMISADSGYALYRVRTQVERRCLICGKPTKYAFVRCAPGVPWHAAKLDVAATCSTRCRATALRRRS